MKRLVPRWTKNRPALVLAGGLALVTLFTFGLGFWATRQWRDSTGQAAETRGEETVALMAEALLRDMKGGQTSVLLPINRPSLESATLYDLADEFARGFARFPYLESFFVWRPSEDSVATYFFSRFDRTPPWDSGDAVGDLYPVVIRRNPAPMFPILTQAQDTAGRYTPFAASSFSLSGVSYQVFVQRFYEGHPPNTQLTALVGFTVNLDWVRQHYFSDFIQQMRGIIGDPTIGIRIIDQGGSVVAASGPPITETPVHVRRFPLLFMDRALVLGPDALAVPEWGIQVDVTKQAALFAASSGTTWTLTLLAIAAIMTFCGLVLTVRATTAAADLAALQSEFVSTVTHEMKTPLALIRLASKTLATGRYESAETTISDYGRLLNSEAGRLTRLIDNVLCFARFTNAVSTYNFERVDVSELVQECVDRFKPELDPVGFELRTNLPVESMEVRADRALLLQVFDNLINNAATHATSGHTLTVTVERQDEGVHVTFADVGPGIAAADLPHIFEKFYRGGNARHRGSGLGLAIVQRIVTDHGGHVTVRSETGRGATFDVALREWDEQASDESA